MARPCPCRKRRVHVPGGGAEGRWPSVVRHVGGDDRVTAGAGVVVGRRGAGLGSGDLVDDVVKGLKAVCKRVLAATQSKTP